MQTRLTVKLPKPYLSWSSLNLWEKDKERWVEQYIYGGKSFQNSAMKFGSRFADRLDGKEDEDEMINTVAELLPGNGTTEYELTVPMIGVDVDLFAKFDNWNDETRVLRERKTGQRDKKNKTPPWNRLKVNAHGQLWFYAFMIYIRDKKLPKEVWLDWIETEVDNEGNIGLTGHTEYFRADINMIGVLKVGARIRKAAQQISERYALEINKIFA